MDSFELDFAGWRGAAHAEVKVQGEPPRAGGAAAVFAASINARDALLGGKIDIGITAIPNFLSAAVADAGVIGVAVDQCASTAVMVKPDAPHRSVVDLKGKRIASQTATATYGMFVNRVLPQSGLKPADINLINIASRTRLSRDRLTPSPWSTRSSRRPSTTRRRAC